MAKKQFIHDPNKPTPFDSLIAQAEADNPSVPKGIIKNLIDVESSYNPQAVSPTGAKGLGQFITATAKGYGVTDPHDPQQAIPAVGRYLTDLGKRYKGNWKAALAQYNGGNAQGYLVMAGQEPTKAETRDYLLKFNTVLAEPFKVQGLDTTLSSGGNYFRHSNEAAYGAKDAYQERLADVAKQRERDEAYSGFSGVGRMFDDAFSLNNAGVAAERTYANSGSFDSGFQVSKESYAKDVGTFGQDTADWLRNTAKNEKHYYQLLDLQEARNEAMARQGRLNGLAGFALNTIAVMSSPETLATLPLGGAAGGLTRAGSFFNASRAARMVDYGLTQGFLNVASDRALESQTGMHADPTLSFAAGAGLGALAGALSRPTGHAVADGFTREIDRSVDKLDDVIHRKDLASNGYQVTTKGHQLAAAQAREVTVSYPDVLTRQHAEHGFSAHQYLDDVIASGDEYAKSVASKVRAALPDDIQVGIRSLESKVSSGDYNAATHGITVNPSKVKGSTPLHELVHAATKLKVDEVRANPKAPKALRDGVAKLDSLLVSSQKALKESADPLTQYAASSVDELLAIGLTHAPTRDALKAISLGGKQTAFGSLMKSVKTMLGVKSNEASAFDELLTHADTLMREKVDYIVQTSSGSIAVRLGERHINDTLSDAVLNGDALNIPNSPLAREIAAHVEGAASGAPSKSVMAKIRVSSDAKLNGSDNVAVREFGSKAMHSVTGKVDKLEVQHQTALDSYGKLKRVWQAQVDKSMWQHFEAYSKENGLGSRWLSGKRNEAYKEWSKGVKAYIQDRSPNAASKYHPTVVAMGNDIAKLLDEVNGYINDPALVTGKSGTVKGLMASKLEANKHYFPKTPDTGKLAAMIQTKGAEATRLGLKKLVYESRKALGKEEALAKDYARRLYEAEQKGGKDFDPASVPKVPEGLDEDMYFDMLCQSTAEHYSRTWLDANAVNKTDLTDGGLMSSKSGNLQHRVDMDEGTKVTLEDGSTLSWDDFTDTNIQTVLGSYLSRMAGDVSLAAHFDIRTAEDWGKVVAGVREEALHNNIGKNGYTSQVLDEEVSYMEWFKDRLQGVPEEPMSKTSSFLALLRDTIYSARSGLFGYNQLQEYAGVMGRYGLHVSGLVMKEATSFLRDVKSGAIRNEDADFLMRVLGDEGDDAKFLRHANADEWVTNWGDTSFNRGMDKLHNDIKNAGSAVGNLSGFNHLNAIMRRQCNVGAHISWVNHANGLQHNKVLFSAEELAWGGLDDAMYQRITGHLKAYSTVTEGKYQRFNWEGFQKADPEAFAAYTTSVDRISAQAVQRNDLNSMSKMMGTTLGKTIFQFRQFLLHAHDRQFIRSIHYKDQIAGMTFIYSAGLGGLLWATRVHISALGRDDAEEYKEKMLSPKVMVGTMVGRTAQAALFPTLIDTLSPEPIFGGYARTSVQSAPDAMSFFTGMPLVDFSKSVFTAVKAPLKASYDDEYQLSQNYAKSTSRLLMGSSLPYITPVLNSITSMFPEQSKQE